MLETRVTKLFGIKHPIIMSGMNWLTEPRLVSAVSSAGGLGILGATQFTPKELRIAIGEIRRYTGRPFGINQVLSAPRSDENIKIALDEKVPVINYSLGRPWFVSQVHESGGKVLASVATTKHAVAAEKAGSDAVIIIGYEAAAHGGTVTSLILVPLVVNLLNIPVIAAGGFYSGRGLAAALLLGADAIAMGTRFMLTQESILHDRFRRLCLRAGEEDTLYDSVFDGMPGRVLKTGLAEALIKNRLPLLTWFSGVLEIKRSLKLSTYEMISSAFRMKNVQEGLSLSKQARLATAAIRAKKAIQDGDEEQGILPIGQCCGGIDDLLPCSELMEQIITEAEEALKATREQVT